MDTETASTLLQAARQAASNAYAPYSNFRVGAALLTQDGQTILGVNVENQSYGLTICAERAALTQAITLGIRDFQAIAVWTLNHPLGAVTPCGACRQVMNELLTPDAPVIFTHPETGAPIISTVGALLPAAFVLN